MEKAEEEKRQSGRQATKQRVPETETCSDSTVIEAEDVFFFFLVSTVHYNTIAQSDL